jgi:hypothetical protein
LVYEPETRVSELFFGSSSRLPRYTFRLADDWEKAGRTGEVMEKGFLKPILSSWLWREILMAACGWEVEAVDAEAGQGAEVDEVDELVD